MEKVKYRASKTHPMPTRIGRGREPKYMFPELEVGMSFFVKSEKEVKAARGRFYRDKQTIVVRAEGNGFRIWRRT
jgi:hypothetical protein